MGYHDGIALSPDAALDSPSRHFVRSRHYTITDSLGPLVRIRKSSKSIEKSLKPRNTQIDSSYASPSSHRAFTKGDCLGTLRGVPRQFISVPLLLRFRVSRPRSILRVQRFLRRLRLLCFGA